MGENTFQPKQPLNRQFALFVKFVLYRKPNWQTELHRFLESRRFTKFSYGSSDCCLFACDAVEAITGTDIAEPFRGQYSTRSEAYRAIEEYAGRASVEAVTERITEENGMPEVIPLRARRGDLILLRRPRDFSLAIVGLRGEILAASKRGFEVAPIALAVRAWRV